MEFHAYHGFYETERKTGGRYTVDVEVNLENPGALQSDDLAGTVNYEAIYRIVRTEMGNPVRLIEHLAANILEALRHELGHPGHWLVRVRKHHPPLPGAVDHTAIELTG